MRAVFVLLSLAFLLGALAPVKSAPAPAKGGPAPAKGGPAPSKGAPAPAPKQQAYTPAPTPSRGNPLQKCQDLFIGRLQSYIKTASQCTLFCPSGYAFADLSDALGLDNDGQLSSLANSNNDLFTKLAYDHLVKGSKIPSGSLGKSITTGYGNIAVSKSGTDIELARTAYDLDPEDPQDDPEHVDAVVQTDLGLDGKPYNGKDACIVHVIDTVIASKDNAAALRKLVKN